MKTKTTKNTLQSLLRGGAALGLTLGAAGMAQAQRERTPEERDQRRQQRRERVENMTPAQREQARAERMRNMTPEQRAAMERWRQQREVARWDWVRQVMTAAGYTDKAMQDEVVSFMQAQEKSREPLQTKARELSANLVKPETSDEQFKKDIATYREAVAKDKTRHETALAALDKKVKYSTQPRLEMLLSVLGVVGHETPTIGGVGAIFPDSPMGRGGRGGGRGGMRGG